MANVVFLSSPLFKKKKNQSRVFCLKLTVILCFCCVPGPGLWAWERVHPGSERSEPGGSGPRTLRPRLHGHRLHLRRRREWRPGVVAESLRGDRQGGGGAGTGHCHHPGSRPGLASNQARPRGRAEDNCGGAACGCDHWNFFSLFGRYSLQGDTKKYFSIGKYSGELKTVQALDREENSTYTMKVIAVDGSESVRLYHEGPGKTTELLLHFVSTVSKSVFSSFHSINQRVLSFLLFSRHSSHLWCHKGRCYSPPDIPYRFVLRGA